MGTVLTDEEAFQANARGTDGVYDAGIRRIARPLEPVERIDAELGRVQGLRMIEEPLFREREFIVVALLLERLNRFREGAVLVVRMVHDMQYCIQHMSIPCLLTRPKTIKGFRIHHAQRMWKDLLGTWRSGSIHASGILALLA